MPNISIQLLSGDLVNQLQIADSPEDAAKKFLRHVTKGLAQVVADAMTDTLASVQVSGKASGFKDLIQGANIQIVWDSVPKLPLEQVAHIAQGKTAGAVGTKGVSFSVGLSGTF